VIGILLILSVLLPNIFREIQDRWRRWQYLQQQAKAGREREIETKQPKDLTT